MPPSASDTFIILKPQEQWPDPKLGKTALLDQIEDAVRELPGNAYEFTQPIQMRFNELLAGVRGVEKKISAEDSKVAVYVIPTNEELVIARDTKEIVEKM